MGENTFARCPACGTEFDPPRWTKAKAKIVAGGIVGGTAIGATTGATIGAGIGVASAGTAIAGTVPLGVVGGALGALTLGIGAKLGRGPREPRPLHNQRPSRWRSAASTRSATSGSMMYTRRP